MLLVVQTMSYTVADGKSNWLEGLILICKLSSVHDIFQMELTLIMQVLYVVIAVSFWFYPGMRQAQLCGWFMIIDFVLVHRICSHTIDRSMRSLKDECTAYIYLAPQHWTLIDSFWSYLHCRVCILEDQMCRTMKCYGMLNVKAGFLTIGS
jgi:hypothetical protein